MRWDDDEPRCSLFICECDGKDPECRTCNGSGYYHEDEYGRTKAGRRLNNEPPKSTDS